MFCSQCGMPVADDAAFCPYCGCETNKRREEQTPAPQEKVTVEPTERVVAIPVESVKNEAQPARNNNTGAPAQTRPAKVATAAKGVGLAGFIVMLAWYAIVFIMIWSLSYDTENIGLVAFPMVMAALGYMWIIFPIISLPLSIVALATSRRNSLNAPVGKAGLAFSIVTVVGLIALYFVAIATATAVITM